MWVDGELEVQVGELLCLAMCGRVGGALELDLHLEFDLPLPAVWREQAQLDDEERTPSEERPRPQ